MKISRVFASWRLFLFTLSFSLLLSSLSIPQISTAEAATGKLPKATWLWDTQLIETKTDELLNFSQSEGIYMIYLQVNEQVDPSYYRSFIREANQRGIQVHALDGAPNWALETKRSHLTTFISWIEDYQTIAEIDEQFTGIHVDIEPYLLDEWKNDPYTVIPQWQANISYLVQEADQIGLPIAADLPFWLNNFNASDSNLSLSEWMIGQLDSVTLMTYRDTATAIITLAKEELEQAERLNKRIYTAVETNYSTEGNHVSFYEDGYDYLNTQLYLLAQLGRSSRAFAGIAVHDLTGMMELAGR